MADDFSNVVSTVNVLFNSVGQQKVLTDLKQVTAQMGLAQKMTQTGFGQTMAIVGRQDIRQLQQYNNVLGSSMRSSAKSISEVQQRMGLLNSALATGNGAGVATWQTLNNMSKGANTFYTAASKTVSPLMAMRIRMDALGHSINAIGLRWQSVAKNMQWTGRQMMVGLSLPLAAGAAMAIKSWQGVNKEITRTAKVMDDFEGSWAPNVSGANKLAVAQDNLYKSARKIGHEYAAVDQIVLAAMSDFAAMGYQSKKELTAITDLAFKTSALGDFDISDAITSVRTLMAVYDKDVAAASETLAKFNLIENNTAISSADLNKALPEVANSAKQFGLSAEETAQMLAAMYENGIPATEAAHALKFSIASLFKPTKQTLDQLEGIAKVEPKIAASFTSVLNGTVKGKKGLEQIALAYRDLEKTFGSQEASELLSNLVGKRQANRMLGLFDSMQEATDYAATGAEELKNDYVVAGEAIENTAEATKMVRKEMEALQNSDAFRMDQAKADFKAFLAQIGKELMPTVLDWFEKLNKVGKKFLNAIKENPALPKMIVAFGVLLAALGPVVYIAGQLGVAFTTVMHTAGKMIPDLGRVKAGFMSLGEKARFAQGKIFHVGDELIDSKGKWMKSLESVKQTIKGWLGMGVAAETTATKSNAATASQIASLKALEEQAQKTGNVYLGAMAKMYGASLGPPTGTGSLDDLVDSVTPKKATGLNIAEMSDEAVARWSAAGTGGRIRELPQFPLDTEGRNLPIPYSYKKEVGWQQDIFDYYQNKILPPKPTPAGEMVERSVKSGPFGDVRISDDIKKAVQPSLFDSGDIDTIPIRNNINKAIKQVDDVVDTGTPNVGKKFFRNIFAPKHVEDGVLNKWFSNISKKLTAKTATAKTGKVSKWGSKFMGSLLGPAGKAGPLAKMFGVLGGAGGGAGISGVLSGIASGLAGIGAAAGIVLAVVAAIAALIAIVAVLSGHWKSFWAGVKSGAKPAINVLKSALDSLKSALKSLWDAVKALFQPLVDIFNEIAQIIGGGGKGKKKNEASGWKMFGQAIGSIATIVAGLAKALAWLVEISAKAIAWIVKMGMALFKMSPIFNMIKTSLITVVTAISDFVRMIQAMLRGDWEEAWRHAQNVVLDIFVNPLIYLLNYVISVVQWAFKQLVNTASSFLDFAGDIPVIGGMFDNLGEKVDGFRDKLNKPWKIEPIRIDVETNTIVGGNKPGKPKPEDGADKVSKRVQRWLDKHPQTITTTINPDEPDNEKLNEWLSALKPRLDEEMNKLKEQAMKNFESMSKARLKVFDDQIKAIEAQEKAEQELYETQQYLNNRRKMLDDFEITKENYKRARALAIYEGRYMDARQLDKEYQVDSRNHSESLKDLDDERSKYLLQKERDSQKERIEIQKQAAEEQLNIMKEGLQAQLDAITEWTPKNVAEMVSMVDQMNAALVAVGAETMGPSMAAATSGWNTAVHNAGKDIIESAYWAGSSAASMAKAGIEITTPNPDFEEALRNAPPAVRKYWDRTHGTNYYTEPQIMGRGTSDGGSRGRVGGPPLVDAAALYSKPYRSDTPYSRYARHTGGYIYGGAPNDVPVTLQTGEYVLQRKAVSKLGLPFLQSLNKYHEGGMVGEALEFMIWKTYLDNLAGFMFKGGKFGGYTWPEVKEKHRPKPKIGSMFAALGAGGGTGMPVGEGGIFATISGYMVDWLQQLLAEAFPDMWPNIMNGSKHRPNSVGSFHFTGQALDIGSNPGNRLDRLVDIFEYLSGNIERFDIVELIHKNRIFHPWDGWNDYGPMDHYDHVHVAVGSWKEGLVPFARGGKVLVDNLPSLLHKGEVVLPSDVVKRMEGGSSGGDTYIMVENFIGQRQWFEQMMKDYNIKTLPSEQRKRGTMNRVVSSRKDNTVRYI